MKKLNISALLLLSALFMTSCADKDSRIGELLFEDLSTNPNISIAYLKNAELPYSSLEKRVTYLIADEKYKDVENDQLQLSMPVEISKPLSQDITIEVIADKERSESLKDKNHVMEEGKEITPKTTKVTIKAGQKKSTEDAVFVVNLKELSGNQAVFPVTLKIEEGRKDCILSQNFKSYDLKVLVDYSMEGMVEMKTQVNPAVKEIAEAQNLPFGWYEQPEPRFFDNNLETYVGQIAYYDQIALANADITVKGFSIQPAWNGASFDVIAKDLEVYIVDENGQEHLLDTFTLPDFSKSTLADNPIIYFEFKKPVNIQGLSVKDKDRDNDPWRTINISEFRLYI